jgi:hypothetical protein
LCSQEENSFFLPWHDNWGLMAVVQWQIDYILV